MKRTPSQIPIVKNVVAAAMGNWKMILMAFLLVVGVVIGTMVSRNPSSEQLSQLNGLLGGFVSGRSTQSVWGTFLYSLLSTVPLVLLTFLLGLCAAGAFLIPIIPLFRGLGLGLSLGYLYQTQGLQGIAFSVLIIILPAILSCMAMLLACCESLTYSVMLCGQMLPNSKNVRMWPEFKRYMIRFLAFLALLCIAALVDAIFSAAFTQFFTFEGVSI